MPARTVAASRCAVSTSAAASRSGRRPGGVRLSLGLGDDLVRLVLGRRPQLLGVVLGGTTHLAGVDLRHRPGLAGLGLGLTDQLGCLFLGQPEQVLDAGAEPRVRRLVDFAQRRGGLGQLLAQPDDLLVELLVRERCCASAASICRTCCSTWARSYPRIT